jgi:hypothetical protein
MVIDSAVILTGSMNWIRGAAVNSEYLNLVSSPAVGVAYAAHWRERLAGSVRGSTAARTGAGRRLRRPADVPEAPPFQCHERRGCARSQSSSRRSAPRASGSSPMNSATVSRENPLERGSHGKSLSPSAELMVSPERSTRCAVRDTGAPGEDRFRWTVAMLGQLDPVAKGRAASRAEARSQMRRLQPISRTGPSRQTVGVRAMPKLFWRWPTISIIS